MNENDSTRGAQLEPLVRAEGLVKRFLHGGRELEVLRGIDFSLYPGEMVSIVGRSGAGKSTLLHILGTIDLPTEGKISFKGQNLKQLNANQLATLRNRYIGFVFQFHHLLPDFTAIENVMMPMLFQRTAYSQARKRALNLLETVGLMDRRAHRPGELSGGEQQRVALARAMVMDPELLLADEPTGNLDSQTGETILEIFFQINHQSSTTMMVVTHNPEVARRIPRRLRMADGLLSEEDPKRCSGHSDHLESSVQCEG